MPAQELNVDTDMAFQGIAAHVSPDDLQGLHLGDVVRIGVPGAEKTKIFIRIVGHNRTHKGTVMVSAMTAGRILTALKKPPGNVTLRALTRGERFARAVTVKRAAAVLALLATLFAAVVGLAPLFASSSSPELSTVRDHLSGGWTVGHELTTGDIRSVDQARAAAARITVAPDQVPSWVKIAGGAVLIVSAIATVAVNVKTADE
jgi:hypothetical protein